ncbi:MAG: hypothetical protein ACP5FP_10720 [Desulfuromonadaceae bacterium]
MKRLLMGFLWLVLFGLLLVGFDQLMLRYSDFEQPFLHDVQEFHADFRRRLFGLPELQVPKSKPHPVSGSAPVSRADSNVRTNIDAVVEREIERVSQRSISAPVQNAPEGGETGALRYIYLDAEQNIQFAERYEDIPPRFRDAVQVVGE